MAKPMILFYNLDNETGKSLKFICLKHKIKIKNIEPSQYAKPLGTLAGILDADNEEEDAPPRSDFSDEMLVFCGFDNRLLDTFLLEVKRNRLKRIALKAVLTEQNIFWDSYTLHAELVKEHEAMSRQDTAHR